MEVPLDAENRQCIQWDSITSYHVCCVGKYKYCSYHRKCKSTDDAYFKLMRFLGKMMKKDNNPRNRYLHKHQDHKYEAFDEVFTDDILQDIREKITI